VAVYTEGIQIGSTGVSMPCVLRSATTFLPITGKVAADLAAAYWIEGQAPVNVTPLSDLAAITTAFTAKGIKEASASLIPGGYRIDWPDACWASNALWVVLCMQLAATGDVVFHEKIPLTNNNPQQAGSAVTLPTTAPSTFLNTILIDGKTLPAALQIIAATTAGLMSGSETNTEIYLGLDGTTTRVTATTDSSGNRTGMVYS
jgi:hypothetical protein